VIPDTAPSRTEEARLIRRARGGQADALDRLVEAHTPRLYRIVRRLASDPGEAEAIVQEAWLRAWRALGSCDPDRPLLPWLARIAVNVARDQARRKRPLDFSDLGGDPEARPDPEPLPEQVVEQQSVIEALEWAVTLLRPEQRAVVALRYDGGLSYQEIAGVLGLEVNTVRTHLHRAKAALRRALEADREVRHRPRP
jgi:RNA polymerase sigma-70 factor, ECF subfamily